MAHRSSLSTPGYLPSTYKSNPSPLRLNAFVYVVTSPSYNPVTSDPPSALVDKEEVLVSVPDATTVTVADVGNLFVKMWNFVGGTTKQEQFDMYVWGRVGSKGSLNILTNALQRSKITHVLIRNHMNCIIPNVYTASEVLTESEKIHVLAVINEEDRDKLTVTITEEESISITGKQSLITSGEE